MSPLSQHLCRVCIKKLQGCRYLSICVMFHSNVGRVAVMPATLHTLNQTFLMLHVSLMIHATGPKKWSVWNNPLIAHKFLLARRSVPMTEIYNDPKSVVLVAKNGVYGITPCLETLAHFYLKV